MPQVVDKPASLTRGLPEDTELVPVSDPRSRIISIDPERMWGAPCFVGTRLPVQSLFQHLESGASLDEFLENFDGVSRQACVAALQMASERLLEGLPGNAAR